MKLMGILLAVSAVIAGCGASPDEAGPATPDNPKLEGEVGPVYLDSSEILLRESDPVQVVLRVQGSLPTPCHQLAWEVEQPTAEGVIEVRLFTLSDPNLAALMTRGGRSEPQDDERGG